MLNLVDKFFSYHYSYIVARHNSTTTHPTSRNIFPLQSRKRWFTIVPVRPVNTIDKRGFWRRWSTRLSRTTSSRTRSAMLKRSSSWQRNTKSSRRSTVINVTYPSKRSEIPLNNARYTEPTLVNQQTAPTQKGSKPNTATYSSAKSMNQNLMPRASSTGFNGCKAATGSQRRLGIAGRSMIRAAGSSGCHQWKGIKERWGSGDTQTSVSSSAGGMIDDNVAVGEGENDNVGMLPTSLSFTIPPEGETQAQGQTQSYWEDNIPDMTTDPTALARIKSGIKRSQLEEVWTRNETPTETRPDPFLGLRTVNQFTSLKQANLQAEVPVQLANEMCVPDVKQTKITLPVPYTVTNSPVLGKQKINCTPPMQATTEPGLRAQLAKEMYGPNMKQSSLDPARMFEPSGGLVSHPALRTENYYTSPEQVTGEPELQGQLAKKVPVPNLKWSMPDHAVPSTLNEGPVAHSVLGTQKSGYYTPAKYTTNQPERSVQLAREMSVSKKKRKMSGTALPSTPTTGPVAHSVSGKRKRKYNKQAKQTNRTPGLRTQLAEGISVKHFETDSTALSEITGSRRGHPNEETVSGLRNFSSSQRESKPLPQSTKNTYYSYEGSEAERRREYPTVKYGEHSGLVCTPSAPASLKLGGSKCLNRKNNKGYDERVKVTLLNRASWKEDK